MRQKKGFSKLSLIMWSLVLVGLGIVLYQIAPMFVPVYRWTSVDFQKIALENNVAVEEIDKRMEYFFRFAPRGGLDEDPAPWQLMIQREQQTPSWVVDESGEVLNELDLLVRCNVISDRTGQGPSGIFNMVGGTSVDRYFRATGWRLPPGSLGQIQGRAVFLFDGGTIEKLAPGESRAWESALRQGGGRKSQWWDDDDPGEWPDRDDGFDWETLLEEKEIAEEEAAIAAEEAAAAEGN